MAMTRKTQRAGRAAVICSSLLETPRPDQADDDRAVALRKWRGQDEAAPDDDEPNLR